MKKGEKDEILRKVFCQRCGRFLADELLPEIIVVRCKCGNQVIIKAEEKSPPQK